MKYFSVDVACEYNETRIVLASNESEAAKKIQDGDCLAIYHQNIGDITNINGIEPTSLMDIRPLLTELTILVT